jgi:predicted secreted Zn-dependent protease
MNAMTGVDCQDRQAAAFIANAVGRRYSLRRLRVAHGEPRGNMFRQTLTAIAMIALTASAAGAASISKSYSYFSIGGSTLDEIESELAKRGPRVRDSGRRHPGVTQMEFKSRIGFGEQGGWCRVVQANVTVKAKVILPKWRRPKRADPDVSLIWDTLASDIKRHEESHVVIAKNHARELERALLAIDRQRTCKQTAERIKAVTTKVLARHGEAQDAFDRVEGINFESRLLRLLRYRLERMEASGR